MKTDFKLSHRVDIRSDLQLPVFRYVLFDFQFSKLIYKGKLMALLQMLLLLIWCSYFCVFLLLDSPFFSSELRTSIDMLKSEFTVLGDVQDMMSDLLKAQFPMMMEEVVHRNTAAVIDSVGETSKQSDTTLEERIKTQVVSEVMQMLEAVSDEVVLRVGGLLNVEPPI